MKTTRRASLCALVGAGCALGASPARLLAAEPVSIPQGPMQLTRHLEHSLRGGASLTVIRSWRVEFAWQGRGIAISGAQIDAEVIAPASLSALAAIERDRSTADMWPILLSVDGRIVAAGPGTSEEDIAIALREAERMISQQPRPAAEKAERLYYLAEVQNAGSSLLDRLPADLFYPSEEPQHSLQEINLPGGLTGQFEVHYKSARASGMSWLNCAEREIVTRVGGDERRAKETWTLTEF